MELSDEQKNKIREEERARLAEEKYRIEVRRELEPEGSAPVIAKVPAPRKKILTSFRVIGILLFSFAVIFFYMRFQDGSANPIVTALYIPQSTKLFSDQITVRHGQMLWMQFKVDTSVMNSVRVIGKVRATGALEMTFKQSWLTRIILRTGETVIKRRFSTPAREPLSAM